MKYPIFLEVWDFLRTFAAEICKKDVVNHNISTSNIITNGQNNIATKQHNNNK